jgi:NitT/TauT family transport system ATP-binding protein
VGSENSTGQKSRLVIEVKNLKKVYHSRGSSVNAVEDVSFDVCDGEFVTIVGHSGCGKTTILKILSGLLPKTSGTASINGKPVTGPHANIGIVFQTPILLRWRSVLENVMLPIEIMQLKKEDYYGRALDLLKLTGLIEFKNRYPKELSGGMQQRVSISRALIHDPPLLFLDEPFGALDVMTRNEMNIELERIWREKKKTSLLITHSIPEAVFLSDRIIVMTPRPGRVADIIDVDLPRPRNAELRISEKFFELVRVVAQKIGLEFT